MTETNQQPVWDKAPLGRIYRLKELPGWLSKSLQVPPNRLGVVITSSGISRTLKPGKYRILTSFQRMLGQGVGLRAGYVPDEQEFISMFNLEYLLTGDRQLLDIRLVCALEVADPVCYFNEVVTPNSEIRDPGVDIDLQSLHVSVETVTTQYAAGDLVQGRADAALRKQVQITLGALLAGKGLRLKEIRLLALSLSENRAIVAEKVQRLHERMLEIELQARMAEVENQAQLQEFIQQLDPSLQQVAHLGVAATEQAPAPKGQTASSLRGLTAPANAPKSQKGFEALRNLFRTKKPTPPKARHSHTYWWLPTVVWIIFVILLGIGLTALIDEQMGVRSSQSIGLIALIWSSAIGEVFFRIKGMHAKQEDLEAENWQQVDYQPLEDLVGNDRKWADEVVREQCAREIEQVGELVTQIRSLEYRRGNTSLALLLKNEIERNAQNCAEKIRNPNYGQPPYVTDLRVNQNAWLDMLARDEDLLLYGHTVTSSANLMLQKAQAGELAESMLTELNTSISNFANRFFERGRPLQMPDTSAPSN